MTTRRILALTAVAACLVMAGLVAVAWSSGVRFYGVESGSMSPFFGRGDLVIDVPTTASTTYRVGDVITFHPTPGYTTTHRIVAIDAVGISTKGDANASADIGQIPPSSVVGRVVGIVPFGGSVAAFFRQPAGIAALLVGMIAIYIAWGLLRGSKPDRPSDPDLAPQEPSEPAGGDPG